MFVDGFGGEITRCECQPCLMVDGCQAECKDGVVFGLVRKPGERTPMGVLQNFLRLELQNSALVFKLHTVQDAANNEWSADSPIGKDINVRFGHPFLH